MFGNDVDFSNPIATLHSLFQSIISPALIFRSSNGSVEIGLSDQFSVNLSDNGLSFLRILVILQFRIFIRTPVAFQKSLLDLLFLILRKDIYTAVRFKFSIDCQASSTFFSKVRIALNYISILYSVIFAC